MLMYLFIDVKYTQIIGTSCCLRLGFQLLKGRGFLLPRNKFILMGALEVLAWRIMMTRIGSQVTKKPRRRLFAADDGDDDDDD